MVLVVIYYKLYFLIEVVMSRITFNYFNMFGIMQASFGSMNLHKDLIC